MKKLLSLALVLALMLTLGVSAFADVYVDGQKKDSPAEVEIANKIVNVSNDDQLTVTTDVKGGEYASSVNANTGAQIQIGGNVGSCTGQSTINAIGSDTEVTVGGDVTDSSTANGATAINAQKYATVIVGGDVEKIGAGLAIKVSDGATVVVEGTVTGMIDAQHDEGDRVYMGQLKDGPVMPYVNNVRYLIGLAEGENYAKFEQIDVVGLERLPFDVDTASGKDYYTVSCQNWLLKETEAFFTANDGSKLDIENIDNLPTGVKAEILENGQVKLQFSGDFKGGLQNLKIVFANIPGPDPTPVPVYYVVPTGSVTVVDFKTPDGIAEGLIKVLDSADHAGLTIDKSLLAEGYDHSVKVTLGEEELPEGAYRFVINWDGSLSVILSTTYLKTLGDGSYDFTATVDDLVIPFTVVVAE